jgi:RimJ/RimL family protein N-acetyltransferase
VSQPHTAQDQNSDSSTLTPHEQMLKLVAKGFYRELIKYGVKEPEILTVAGHLLDNVVLTGPPTSKRPAAYSELFTIKDVQDDSAATGRLKLHDVSLAPLDLTLVPMIATWLESPKVRNSFFPRYPESPAGLTAHFRAPDCGYFSIFHHGDFVGIIGAEHIDLASSKAEMKKLIGDPAMQGKGIGKRATFLFLYHMFTVRRLFKIYLHTMDINIRNLNLNGNFGFWLEGVFFEDVTIDGTRQDVVRMALTAPAWKEFFK